MVRGRDAEHVALGVGENHPRDGVALSDIDSARSERLCSRDLSRLVVGAEVEVEAVLDSLALWNPAEQDVGRYAIDQRRFA